MSALTTTTGSVGKRRAWRAILGAAAIATVLGGFGASTAQAHDWDDHRGGWDHDRGGWGHDDWRGRGWGHDDWRRHWERDHWVYGGYGGGWGYYAPPRVVYVPPRPVPVYPAYPGYYGPGVGVTFSVR